MNTIIQFVAENPVLGQIALAAIAGFAFYKVMPGLLEHFDSHGKEVTIVEPNEEEVHHREEVAEVQLECYKDYMRQSRTCRLMAKETRWFWMNIYYIYKANQYRDYALQHWELYAAFSGRHDNIGPEHLVINSYGSIEQC
ncbi:hypothetical protein AAHN97_15180 [Chitinophaga niabensis]|uniref:hypothetical protein n=1 Tax=Chitinophaga niabensis TaxID=536979 RepID=UPI0031BB4FD5